MRNIFLNFIIVVLCFFSLQVFACGDNPNAIVQGPFADHSLNGGMICFQNTDDKRNVEFYVSYQENNNEHNKLIDTFYYSDAPVELMSVFFAQVNDERNVVVLLRWHVNYLTKGISYPYYYEVRTYKKQSDSIYAVNLTSDKDPNLAGYESVNNGKVTDYPLSNASEIRKYLKAKHKGN
ncbi:hypothetical protein [Yersinia vastinensis]|uniref:hypothetical protein n=1 Tax=Yersinia vastinensis TaxID=2890318 RepID=UPI00119F1FA7|nr:hypothetical protein [Yersinia vastinensis]